MLRRQPKKKGPDTMEVIELVIKAVSAIAALIAAIKS